MKWNDDFSELDISNYTEYELARLSRSKWYEQAMRLRTLEEKELQDELFSIDIRVLTYLFLCANPDVTQGEFARKIGTNPVALSRAINTERFIIKSEWVKDIEDLLANFDITKLMQKIQRIHEVQKKIHASKRRESIASIISAYYGFKEYDELSDTGTYWNPFTHFNAILFTDAVSKMEWAFWDNEAAQPKADNIIDDPFDFLSVYMNVVPNGRMSIVTSDVRTYDVLVSYYLSKKQPSPDNTDKLYRSIILVDIEGKHFIREHILS